MRALNIVSIALWFGWIGFSSPVRADQGCRTDPYGIAQDYAGSFCEMLENAYLSREAISLEKAYCYCGHICSGLESACKTAMEDTASHRHPFCHSLIKAGWKDSAGKGADEAWSEFIERFACLHG